VAYKIYAMKILRKLWKTWKTNSCQ